MHYFEFENELKFYNRGSRCFSSELIAGSGVVHAKPGKNLHSHMEDKKCQ